jgi:hypothetical protein
MVDSLRYFSYNSEYWRELLGQTCSDLVHPDAFQFYLFPALCLALALWVGVALGRRRATNEATGVATTLQQKIDLIYQQLNKLTELITSTKSGAAEKAQITLQ